MTEWPNIAEVAAAIEAGDSSATADSKATPQANADAEGKSTDAGTTTAADASKPQATPTDTSAQDEKKDDPAGQSASDLAALLREDPRKALATLPEDVVDAMQQVLYPKLHQKLSKRDTDHRAEVQRLQREQSQALTTLTSKIDERIDEVLARTMDPDQFEEFKRGRTAKAEEDKRKNIPDPQVVARQAEVQATVTHAWDMIADEGFPVPTDLENFSDMTDEVKAIWQAGWDEQTPLKALRAMRAKARELKSGKTAPTPQRDPATGKFTPSSAKVEDEKKDDLDSVIAKAIDERLLAAGLANTGSRPGAPASGGGKAPSWEENRQALADALRNASR